MHKIRPILTGLAILVALGATSVGSSGSKAAGCSSKQAGLPCTRTTSPPVFTTGPVCLPQPICPQAQPYASCDHFLSGSGVNSRAHPALCCLQWGCYRFHR